MSLQIQRKDDRDDWVKVLELMYENQTLVKEFESSIKELGINQALGEKRIRDFRMTIGITKQKLLKIIRALEELDYVKTYEYDPSTDDIVNFGLTQHGFQLAHQIKTERQRRNTNIILLVLTAILTVLTVVLVVAELGFI